MIEMNSGRCQGTKKDGTACRFPANAFGYCHRHDPSREARERRSNGGRNGGNASVAARREAADRARGLPPIELKTIQDAAALREQTINDYRTGQIDLELAKLQLRATRDHSSYILDVEAIDMLQRLEEIRKELGLDDCETWNRITQIHAARGARIIGRKQ